MSEIRPMREASSWARTFVCSAMRETPPARSCAPGIAPTSARIRPIVFDTLFSAMSEALPAVFSKAKMFQSLPPSATAIWSPSSVKRENSGCVLSQFSKSPSGSAEKGSRPVPGRARRRSARLRIARSEASCSHFASLSVKKFSLQGASEAASDAGEAFVRFSGLRALFSVALRMLEAILRISVFSGCAAST